MTLILDLSISPVNKFLWGKEIFGEDDFEADTHTWQLILNRKDREDLKETRSRLRLRIAALRPWA